MTEISSDIFIRSKTVAIMDSASSRGFDKCLEEPAQVNILASCIIRNDNKQFIKSYTAVFDKESNLLSLYKYLQEVPDVISLGQLQNDTAVLDIIRFQFQINNGRR